MPIVTINYKTNGEYLNLYMPNNGFQMVALAFPEIEGVHVTDITGNSARVIWNVPEAIKNYTSKYIVYGKGLRVTQLFRFVPGIAMKHIIAYGVEGYGYDLIKYPSESSTSSESMLISDLIPATEYVQ